MTIKKVSRKFDSLQKLYGNKMCIFDLGLGSVKEYILLQKRYKNEVYSSSLSWLDLSRSAEAQNPNYRLHFSIVSILKRSSRPDPTQPNASAKLQTLFHNSFSIKQNFLTQPGTKIGISLLFIFVVRFYFFSCMHKKLIVLRHLDATWMFAANTQVCSIYPYDVMKFEFPGNRNLPCTPSSDLCGYTDPVNRSEYFFIFLTLQQLH